MIPFKKSILDSEKPIIKLAIKAKITNIKVPNKI